MITSALIISILGSQSLFAMTGELNPNDQLIQGVTQANLALVQTAVARGADIDIPMTRSKITALHHAVYEGYYDIVKYLLEHGANPNSADISGNTPLRTAVSKNDTRIIQLLVDHGADPTSLVPENDLGLDSIS